MIAGWHSVRDRQSERDIADKNQIGIWVVFMKDVRQGASLLLEYCSSERNKFYEEKNWRQKVRKNTTHQSSLPWCTHKRKNVRVFVAQFGQLQVPTPFGQLWDVSESIANAGLRGQLVAFCPKLSNSATFQVLNWRGHTSKTRQANTTFERRVGPLFSYISLS